MNSILEEIKKWTIIPFFIGLVTALVVGWVIIRVEWAMGLFDKVDNFSLFFLWFFPPIIVAFLGFFLLRKNHIYFARGWLIGLIIAPVFLYFFINLIAMYLDFFLSSMGM